MDFKKKFDELIAEMRFSGHSEEVIKETFEDSLDDILADEKDAEMIGKYSG